MHKFENCNSLYHRYFFCSKQVFPDSVASTAISFSTTGITLAFIQRKLREINKKIDLLLDVSRKAAKDKLAEALTSLEHENYADAFEAFKICHDKASEGFHCSQVCLQ